MLPSLVQQIWSKFATNKKKKSGFLQSIRHLVDARDWEHSFLSQIEHLWLWVIGWGGLAQSLLPPFTFLQVAFLIESFFGWISFFHFISFIPFFFIEPSPQWICLTLSWITKSSVHLHFHFHFQWCKESRGRKDHNQTINQQWGREREERREGGRGGN